MQDVCIMAECFLKFNKEIRDVYCTLASQYSVDQRAQEALRKKWLNQIFVKSTLSSTAHFIVNNTIRRGQIQPLNDIEVYKAARSSFNGGIC